MNKFKTKIKTVMLSVLAAVMMLSVCPITSHAADVAGMAGKGTKASPYIVTTAEQLDAVRNNLKAHYKLGNTIDLSAYADFEPIGNLKTPFRGTFTCDTDKQGRPLYAIKNLKTSFDGAGASRANKYSGYKEDGSMGWDVALFGTTDGATFKNILVLDVNVTNEAEGWVRQNSDYSLNPGMDDMGTAALIAIAKNTTITGCGASGKVDSNSNHIGGLVGYADKCTIKNSYSYVSVNSRGTWGGGGLLGSAISTKVDSCFYQGNFTIDSAEATHHGAFAGSVYDGGNAITNCWAAGTMSKDNAGCFLGTKVHTDGSQLTNTSVASNCYTTVKIPGRTKAMTNTVVTNNNYVTDEPGILELGFAVVTKDKLNEIFGAMSAWTAVSGGYPQLKNVTAVDDSSLYVVGKAINGTPVGATTNSESETTGNTTENTTTGEVVDETGGGEATNNISISVNVQDEYVKLKGQEKTIVLALLGMLGVLVFMSVLTVVITLARNTKKDKGTVAKGEKNGQDKERK